MLDDPDLPNHLPPAPRPLTSRAKWRSWNELPVRVWVIVTLAVVLAGGYVTATRIRQAKQDRWLIEYGVSVNAKVVMGNGSAVPKRWLRDTAIPAKIQVTLPGAQPVELDVIIEPRQGEHLQVGGELPIKVDPRDPRRWTEETRVKPWSTELVVPAMLVPLIIAVAGTTLFRRYKILQLWTHGRLTEGVIVDTRHTAMAPGARIVRFSQADGDPRIFNLLLPTDSGIPQPGARIWLLTPEHNPNRAIAAALYLDPRA